MAPHGIGYRKFVGPFAFDFAAHFYSLSASAGLYFYMNPTGRASAYFGAQYAAYIPLIPQNTKARDLKQISILEIFPKFPVLFWEFRIITTETSFTNSRCSWEREKTSYSAKGMTLLLMRHLPLSTAKVSKGNTYENHRLFNVGSNTNCSSL